MNEERETGGGIDEPGVSESGRVRIVGAGTAGEIAAAAGGAGGEEEPEGQRRLRRGLGRSAERSRKLASASSETDVGPGTGDEPAFGTAFKPSFDLRKADPSYADNWGTPGDPAPGEGTATELPHWTEDPTGEVPSSLVRETSSTGTDEDDPWSQLPEPTWREEHSDWVAHEENFEAGWLADDETRHGSLGYTRNADRDPWTFEVPVSGEVEATEGDDFERLLDAASREVEGRDQGAGMSETSTGMVVMEPAPEATQADVPQVRPVPMRPMTAAKGEGSGAIRRVSSRPAVTPLRSVMAGEESGERGLEGETGSRADRLVPPGLPEPKEGDRNLGMAIVTGVILGGVALACFKIGSVASMVVVTGVVVLAAAEAYAAFRKAGLGPATLLGLVGTLGLIVGAYNKGAAALLVVVPVMVVFTMLWQLFGVETGTDAMASTMSTLMIFSWIAVPCSFAGLMLDPTLFPRRTGIAFLLGAIIVVVFYDVGAYAAGRLFGRHPLSPKTSPNKTWEGLIGGTLAALTGAGLVVAAIHPWTGGAAIALGCVVAVLAPVGDLSESMVKRHLGLKDMGRFLPGHGGILDRVDGLILVLPATYFLVSAARLG